MGRRITACCLAAVLALCSCIIEEIGPKETARDYTKPIPVFQWVPKATLVSGTSTAGQEFGWSVDICVSGSDAWIAVGAPEESDCTGAAYVFSRSSAGAWDPTPEKITAPDAATYNYFGYNVRFIDADTLLIAAPGRATTEGAVYVFEKSGTAWQAAAGLSGGRLDPPTTRYFFGWSLEVSDSYIFIGDWYDSNRRGAAHVYSTADYLRKQTLTVPGYTLENGDRFGLALAGSEDFLFAGAARDDDTATDAGALYMYRKSGATPPWLFVDKFQSPSPDASAYFGSSLALHDLFLLVGAPGLGLGANAAQTRLFQIEGTTSISHQQLFEPTDIDISKFGNWVSVSDNFLLVCDPFYNDASQGLDEVGRVFLYRMDAGAYTELPPVYLETRADGDRLGYSSAMAASIFCVGVPRNVAGGAVDPGVVLVYQYEQTN